MAPSALLRPPLPTAAQGACAGAVPHTAGPLPCGAPGSLLLEAEVGWLQRGVAEP